ncbi:MAG: DNA recombination protein RmuC [Rhodobacteraceae bacterium]|nr:MAG: DNA recombination protein RmuC [Paracoccaceae bacterium]
MRAEREALAAEITRLDLARAVAETEAARTPALEAALEAAREQVSASGRATAALEAQLGAQGREHAARLEELRGVNEAIRREFEALAAKALDASSERFLTLAAERFQQQKQAAEADLAQRETKIGALVKPIADSLSKFEARIGEIEKAREGAYHGVVAQVQALSEGQRHLHAETGKLVRALRAPKTRGRWGEFQLRQVFEMAGMVEHVDFVSEHHLAGADGALRPDAVVRLPGGKAIVVDAKTPLDAFLDGVEAADDAARDAAILRHARQVKAHVAALSAKEYWQALPVTPDFVVMFVPGEAFYAAAMEEAPDLFEHAVRQRVLIATPTTLIALVKAVAYGWQQEKLAENAQRIAESARDLFERIRVFGDHVDKLGGGIRQTVERYNRMVGSLEGRILPTARKLHALGVAPAGREPPVVEALDVEPRPLTAPELAAELKVVR